MELELRDGATSRPNAVEAESASMTINPITVEVVRNAVNAYADEMATALCKSAYNMMIYEVRDFCCGLIDTQARMISQNQGGLPIFLADLGRAFTRAGWWRLPRAAPIGWTSAAAGSASAR